MGLNATERAAFVDGLPPGVRATFALRADLDAQLEQLLATARAAWPDVVIAPAKFLLFVAHRLPAADALARLFVADLYLACAWLEGDTAAHDALEAGPFREAVGLLARFQAPADSVAEAKQATRALLFARDAGHAGLAGYNGRGPLRAWLGVVLVRELLQLVRKDRRLSRFESGELAGLVDSDGDPETIYLRTVYGEQFRRAFADALRDLDAGDKRLLRYAVVERLTIDDVSALAGVHRATAARRIVAARERLLGRARGYMKERLRVDSAELESILRLCDHDLDVSVQRLLGEA
jgi:RNA polymerase sigma-70 factor (ECF subfamily)